MTSELSKALVRRFYEALVANDVATLNEVLAPDFLAYSFGAGGPQSRAMHLQGISLWNAAFETHFTLEDQIAEGDRVATRTIMRVTHSRGDFQGHPPTGKTLEIGGVTVERIQDGKIVERWVYSDRLGVLLQNGLVSPPQAER